MIASTIVSGNVAKKVIFRAIGPSLADDDVSDPLQDPVLELYGPDGSLIVANDNWKDLQQTDIESSELKPEDDPLQRRLGAGSGSCEDHGNRPRARRIGRECDAITLPPGDYTAIVAGKNNTFGVGLVEIYNLQ